VTTYKKYKWWWPGVAVNVFHSINETNVRWVGLGL